MAWYKRDVRKMCCELGEISGKSPVARELRAVSARARSSSDRRTDAGTASPAVRLRASCMRSTWGREWAPWAQRTTRFDRFACSSRPTDEHIEEANRRTSPHGREAEGPGRRRRELHAPQDPERWLQQRKFASLRRTEENEFDVDLAAYFSGEGATKESLDMLLQFTRDQLRDIYPNKAEGEFEAKKSAVRVSFVSGIRLHVDVAPIIHDDSLGLENGGWIPRADGWRLTSVTCHNQFVATRTAESKRVAGPVKFNRLVRMVKWWNNQQADLAQPSILCDCIAAAAFAEVSVTDIWVRLVCGMCSSSFGSTGS